MNCRQPQSLTRTSVRVAQAANKTDAGSGSKAICRVSNVLRSPSRDTSRWAHYAMLQFWSIGSELTNLLVWFGIPVYVFYRRPKSGDRNLGLRFLVGVLATWFGLLLHREFIGLPVALARAQTRGNLEHDGVGMNAALLVGGWIFGLISSTVALVTFLALRYVRKRQQQKPSA